MKYTILLFFVFVLAGVLRIYQLDKYPVGFHIDEASLGYNGYSILKTGKDEHGVRMPLYIDMFGDNRPSGYHILTIAPIAIFGLNEFAVRLPGALFGTFTIVSFYYLVWSIFKDKKTALCCSVLMAISPWHIVSSRASAESIVALFFVITGIACVLHSLQNRNVKLLLIGFVSLIASFQFYHTPRVFVPLLIVSIFMLCIKITTIHSRKFIIIFMASCLILISISFLLVFIIKGGTGRFTQVSIFGSPETRLVMEEQFREDGSSNVPAIVTRVIHNKIFNYTYTFITNYSDYFSGRFLFLEGGRPLWYRIPQVGLIYLVELPFIIIGFVYLFIHRNPYYKIPLIWLFISPLVASVTTDDVPNVQRVMVMFPMIEILAGYGLLYVLAKFKYKTHRIMLFIISLLIFGNGIYFLHQYFVHGSTHNTTYRFNGFKQLVLSIKNVYNDFDTIIITKTSGGMYPHILFFMKYDPATYQKEGSPIDPSFGGFGKFIFTPQFCPSTNGDDRFPKSDRLLYVDSGTCDIPLIKIKKKIYREDGSMAFILAVP